jgi:pimeloyl-ACP methyl ester carboxylesterase
MTQTNLSVATVVLVHAAWADASSWNKVIRPLQRKGVQVVAVQIPLTSLSDDVATVRRTLKRVSGPVVLVGHSYGGAPIMAAGSGNLNLKALVYTQQWLLTKVRPSASSSITVRHMRAPRRLYPTRTRFSGCRQRVSPMRSLTRVPRRMQR